MNRRVLPVVLLVAFPVVAIAQDSTLHTHTTPFRPGQWAAQFQAGLGFASLGFIKFRSPTHALILDLRIQGSHSEQVIDTTAGNRFAGLNSMAYAQLRFGWRGYHGDGNAAKVVAHHTLGVLAGLNHFVNNNPNTGSYQRNGWVAGAFGELGATYLVTSSFGVGALGTASVTYSSSVYKSSGGGANSRDWSLDGSALAASLVATVFF